MNAEMRDLSAKSESPKMNKSSRLGALNMEREMEPMPAKNVESTTTAGIAEHSVNYCDSSGSNTGKYAKSAKGSAGNKY